ncbi:importin-13 isoform X2 [Agrilus planipennis]|nr:importin-13 isoform X2 [Agrilus planipennis]XP_018334258.1 importin-13 isoform X2 [Agrilus planipennis]XP_018334259.1 importin-13 isoform X2 [Agrilus planipennis]XP_018334260.1 importin-13 isoform X2 [Agrilus planipennis]
MELTPENIERAVSLFYQSETRQQAEAHQWLTAAQNSPQAWQFVWNLLSSKRSSEVQFFAATTLHTKLLRYWYEIPEDQYISLRKRILESIVQFANGPKIVLNRLCITLSAYIIHTIPTHWPNAFEELVSSFQPNFFPNIEPERVIWILLEILTVIPEEFQSMTLATSQRNRVRTVLQTVSRDILRVVEMCLSPLAGAGFHMANLMTYLNSARCASAWVQLGGVTIEDCTHLMELLVDLTCFIYWCSEDSDGMASEEMDLIEVTLEALSSIILHPQTYKYKSYVSRHATNFLQNFNKILEKERHSPNSNKDIVAGIYGLIVTLADTHSKQFIEDLKITNANGRELSITLLDCILKCSDLPGMYPVDESSSTLTFGFWFTLQDDVLSLDTAERTELLFMIKPYYRQLVVILLRKSQYPGSWEESGWSLDDQEVFRCYRQDITDTLMYCYNILNVEMLDILTFHLNEAICSISSEKDWTPVESCIHAFSAIAECVEYENLYLPKLITTLKSIPYHMLNSKVYAMALETIGAYSEWISERPELISNIIPLILMGLNESEVAANATMALKDVTQNCQKFLCPYAEQILQTCQVVLQGGQLKLSEQVRIMYSIGKIMSLLPVPKLMEYLNPMLSPSFQEIDMLLKTDQIDTSVTCSIISKLKIISSLFCTLHIKAESYQEQPILTIVKQTLPLYMEVAARYCKDSDVMEVLSSLLKHTIVTLMDDCKPIVPDILNLINAAYIQHPQTSLLNLAKTILVMFAKDEEYRNSMKRLLSEIVNTTLQMYSQLSSNNRLSEKSDVTDGFFAMLTQILKKEPTLITANESIDCSVLFQYAIICLSVPETQTLKVSTSFLVNFISQSRENGHADAVLQSGEFLLTRIFLNLGGSGPRSSVEILSEILLTLNKKYCDNFSRWLHQLLSQKDFPSPRLTNQHKEHFIKMVLKEKANKRRLADCVMEFTLICRGIVQVE